MTNYLFDPPLYLVIGLLLAGVFLAYTGLSRGLKGMQIAGLGAVLSAVVWYGVGRAVETGPERVTRLTGKFVDAADRRDWATFTRLLDPKVRLERYADRDQLVAGAKKTIDVVGVKNITATGYEVVAEPGGFNVSFTATADVNLTGQRTPTSWKFFWAEAATLDGYQIYRIDSLGSPFGPNPVPGNLASP